MSIAFVNSNSTTFTSNAAPTIQLTPAAVNNSIILVVSTTADATINSVTDDSATPPTYSSIVNHVTTPELWLFKANAVSEADLTTFTVNFAANATGSIHILEFSTANAGLTTNQSSFATNTSTATHLTAAAGAIDTAAAVLVVMALRPGSTATFTTPGTYVRIGSGTSVFVAYNIYAGAQSDEGSTNNTVGLSTTRSGPGIIASFTETPAAGGGQPFRKRWGGIRHNAYTRPGVF